MRTWPFIQPNLNNILCEVYNLHNRNTMSFWARAEVLIQNAEEEHG